MHYRFTTLLCLSFAIGILQSQVFADLKVGVAYTEITPSIGVDRMIGMNNQQSIVDSVHDSLYSNVIIFENEDQQVALVSLDLLVFDTEYLNAIREGITKETGIRDVICSLTHTHGSGRAVPSVAEKIVSSTIQTAVKASLNMEPAQIGTGSGSVDESYNRRLIKEDGSVEMLWNNKDRIETAPLDNEVGVVSIRRASDASIIATLINYTAHPVVSMNFEKLIVSADYPGVMSRKVEARLGGRCFFFLGAAGDINAYDADSFRYASEEEVFESIDRLSETLAEEVERVSKGIDEFASDLPLAYESFNLEFALRDSGPNAKADQSVEMNTFLIGDKQAFVTFAGELFVELGIDLKRRSPAASTFILACTNDSFSYLPTIKATTEGGYGAESGTVLEVGAGERMVDQAIVSLYKQLGMIKPLQGR